MLTAAAVVDVVVVRGGEQIRVCSRSWISCTADIRTDASFINSLKHPHFFLKAKRFDYIAAIRIK